MKVECPGCGWSAEVSDEKIPNGRAIGICPKCKIQFTVLKPALEIIVEQTAEISPFLQEEIVVPPSPTFDDNKPKRKHLSLEQDIPLFDESGSKVITNAMLCEQSFTVNGGTLTFNVDGTLSGIWVNYTWGINSSGQLVIYRSSKVITTSTLVSGNITSGWTLSTSYEDGTTASETLIQKIFDKMNKENYVHAGHESPVSPKKAPESASTNVNLADLFHVLAFGVEDKKVRIDILGMEEIPDTISICTTKGGMFDTNQYFIFNNWYWNHESMEFVKIKGEAIFGAFSQRGVKSTFRMVDYVVLHNNINAIEQISNKDNSSNPLSGALIGGVLGGPLGALTGAALTNKKSNSVVFACQLNDGRNFVVTSHPDVYSQIYSMYLNQNCNKKQASDSIDTTPGQQPIYSVTNEIIKLSKLMEQGLLTNEEFILLKQKIINNYSA